MQSQNWGIMDEPGSRIKGNGLMEVWVGEMEESSSRIEGFYYNREQLEY